MVDWIFFFGGGVGETCYKTPFCFNGFFWWIFFWGVGKPAIKLHFFLFLVHGNLKFAKILVDWI